MTEFGAGGPRIEVTSEEVTTVLGSIPLLQQLPGISVQKIAEVVKPMRFGKGELLLREGSPGEGLYFLWQGEAEVSLPSSGVKLGHTMAILKPGDYFGFGMQAGEIFVALNAACAGPNKTLHKADVTAVTEVTCFVLHHENADLLYSVSIWAQQPEEGGVAILERILQLETLEVDLYRGFTEEEYPSFGGNVYGGQLLGQALAAASKSVDPALLVHSLHSYFLRTGDDQLPLIYKVDRTRDGHSFATRQVFAMQKGRVIFTMYASFQRPEKGLEHQKIMPTAPAPDKLLLKEELQRRYLSDPRIPLKDREHYVKSARNLSPVDVKETEPTDKLSSEVLPHWQSVWIKAKGKLTDEPPLHRCAAAYLSDWTFLETSLRPHAHRRSEMRLLSLDHSMWFHKPFRADEWLLFWQSSPQASNGRGLVFGHFYTQSGELVMSASQEGLLRKVRPGAAAKSKL